MRSGRHSHPDALFDARGAENGDWSLALRGRWDLEKSAPDVASALPEEWESVRRIRFRDTNLRAWDSSLILFLLEVADQADARGVEIDTGDLPSG